MFRPFMMRWIFTWLLLLGVCAGLQARTFALDPCVVISSMQGHSDHGHGHPCDPEHDKNCPQDHHDHGCFCHIMPLADASDQAIRLSAPCRSLSRLCHERETAPDGPFLSEDKPPLI
jgi:hypothetical protein